MRAPAARRMIVPGPARGCVDLKADAAAKALARGDSNRFRRFCHFSLFASIVIARSECDEAIHSSFVALWIASRSLSSGAHSRDPLARNDVHVLRPAPIHYEQDNRYSRSPHRHRTSPGYTASTEIRAAGGAAGPDWR